MFQTNNFVIHFPLFLSLSLSLSLMSPIKILNTIISISTAAVVNGQNEIQKRVKVYVDCKRTSTWAYLYKWGMFSDWNRDNTSFKKYLTCVHLFYDNERRRYIKMICLLVSYFSRPKLHSRCVLISERSYLNNLDSLISSKTIGMVFHCYTFYYPDCCCYFCK